MSVGVRLCACEHVCAHVCVCDSVPVCVSVYVRMCVRMCVRLFKCTCVSVCVKTLVVREAYLRPPVSESQEHQRSGSALVKRDLRS